MSIAAEEAARLIEWLREKVQETRVDGVVFGLSGGVDSAVVAGLASQAIEQKALGLILPCHSDPQDESDARSIAEAFNLPIQVHDLSHAFSVFLSAFSELSPGDLALANLKARLRMNALYLVANEENRLVIGTSNLSEITVGYFTKWGDSACDIRPLACTTKGEVRALASHLGVPKSIIAKPPSAGLWPGQTDEEELGVTYNQIDAYICGEELPPAVRERISLLDKGSRHKREFPPAPCQNQRTKI